jgi:ATP phosphoribosyltransferase regulatory subunit
MTRSDLVEELAARFTQLAQRDAELAVKTILDAVSDALVRGGRYDEVGAAFGRNRPAAGFSLDVKQLVGVVKPRPLKAAIRAPWGIDVAAAVAIAALRAQGETVVCMLPGHGSEVDEFDCRWMVRSL